MFTKTLRKFATFQSTNTALSACGVLVAFTLMASAPVHAQNASITLDLNDDAVRLTGQQIVPARQLGYGGSVFNHQDRGLVVTGDFHITGNAATKARPITAGLGARVVYVDVDDDFVPSQFAVPDVDQPDGVLIDDGGLGNLPDSPLSVVDDPAPFAVPKQSGYALAVGGFFKGQIPNYDRVGYGGHVYYSPDVLAFGDLEDYVDAALYASYGVLRNGDVYLGVRVLKADFDEIGDFNFDTGMHVGFTLKF